MGTPNHRLLVSLALVPCLFLCACAFAPTRVPADQFDYNEAIGRSANEQMLLNLVRLRYRDAPVFLAVSSVLTQYVYAGELSVSGAAGTAGGFNANTIGGAANLLYIERPTITYGPLTGNEFAQQLLTPIPSELLFSLVQSGWPPELLLVMGIERINQAENLPFFSESSPEDRGRQTTFGHVVGLVIELAKREAIEMQQEQPEAVGTPAPRYLVFEGDPDPDTQALIDELKQTLNLDPRYSRFRVTDRVLGRKPDEITMRVRSLLAVMGFLSRGVEIPTVHLEEGRVSKSDELMESESRLLQHPLHIRSSVERPRDSFVAVQYQGNWFYVAHSDQTSKEAFTLITYLFQLQAPQAPTQGPLLTVPTG
ncbi:MAG: hypothetical protein L0Y67_07200 [Gammaproteobacteria bacterium]|nr:hypothetical protein [Gammaproteobacteria bacterium]MCI0591371.1 hypothetical protein [Gammaproteobacteria bacterium]